MPEVAALAAHAQAALKVALGTDNPPSHQTSGSPAEVDAFVRGAKAACDAFQADPESAVLWRRVIEAVSGCADGADGVEGMFWDRLKLRVSPVASAAGSWDRSEF